MPLGKVVALLRFRLEMRRNERKGESEQVLLSGVTVMNEWWLLSGVTVMNEWWLLSGGLSFNKT
jgi:hypothetical protein